MGKILKEIIFVIYLLIAIAITICLLSYNKYKVTELGDYSLVIVDGSDFSPTYNKGDLLIINGGDKIETGNEIFYYVVGDNQVKISKATVENITKVSDFETTYELEGDRKISSLNVIGTTNTIKVVKHLGTALWILESKWGFLFIIVAPALILFVRQIMVVIADVKGAKER